MGISRIHVPNKEHVSILFQQRLIASINVVTLNDYTLKYNSKRISNFFKLFAKYVLFETDRTIEFPYSAKRELSLKKVKRLLQHLSMHACMDLGRTRALEQEMRDLDVENKQIKKLKASYGVTSPQELRRDLDRRKYRADLKCQFGKENEDPHEHISNITDIIDLFHSPRVVRDQEKDPGFTIPCAIRKIGIKKALANLGASISLMPYSMFARLDLGELKPTRMCIELASKSTQYSRGIAENDIVKIDKFIFPVDFVVLDMEEDHKISIILGRPFLATAHAMIDVFNKKITFEVGNKTITFDIEKSMKFSTPEDDSCLSIDMEMRMMKLNITEASQMSLDCPPSRTIWEPNDFIKPTLFTVSTTEAEAQLPKLKELPSHLEYAFLNDNQEFPVIISSLLSLQEKE
ncbi:hypothetical protein Tco_0924938 [Tanacetum coccineum]|uniref:Aspartic peptidase DDI1-type domain-containing protein n=1 Tax=Tanacetum coccineum TaxID=301880 RepID=A0ABQ5D6G9_9ASTR